MTQLHNVNLGEYNTFYNSISVSNSIIGDYVYVADRTKIINSSIGKFCSIGPDVKIGLGMHPTNFLSTFPGFFSTSRQCQISFTDKGCFQEVGKNKIGNDVWIGANAIILDNISIGDGAVIGAGAVVTKDVESYSIVGGIPARLIKKRFTDDQIQKLLKLQWWNSDIEWIKQNAVLFNKPHDFLKIIWKDENLEE